MRKRTYYELAYLRGATMKYTQPALRFETRVEWALLMCKRTHVHEVDKTQYIRGWLDGYAGKEQGQ